MSTVQKPFEVVPEFNPVNYAFTSYQNSVGANKTNFPIVQGLITLQNGSKWQDGTGQHSAYTGAGAFGSSSGITYTSADITLDDDGRITAIQNGSGGGGGGNVNNPMTSDLDANGFSINNIDTVTAMDGTFSGQLTVVDINDTEAPSYYSMGAVLSGIRYFIASIPTNPTSEASGKVVLRILDAGVKQNVVFEIVCQGDGQSQPNSAHINVISNTYEGDTPVITKIGIGTNGSVQSYCYVETGNVCTRSEMRVYQNQAGLGTQAPYGTPWKYVAPWTAAGPPTVINCEITLVKNSAMVSNSFYAVNEVDAKVGRFANEVITQSLLTNTIAENAGVGTVTFLNSINMDNNDIQSATTVGALAFVGAALNITIPIGHPTNGPIFVDTQNNLVGIGIPAPQSLLDVAKEVRITSSLLPSLTFYSTTSTDTIGQIQTEDTTLNGGDMKLKVKSNGGLLYDAMTIFQDGRVRLSLNRIENMSDPLNAQDAATKAYVDASIPSLAGYVQNPMTSVLDASAFTITNLPTPSAASEAATKAYVDGLIPTGFVTNPMSADLDGGAFSLFNAGKIDANTYVNSAGTMTTKAEITTLKGDVIIGDAINNPFQGQLNVWLPFQNISGSGIMPRWNNGYLNPQQMGSRCVCEESVTAPGSNKLNAASLISSNIAAYTLATTSGSNILLEIPAALDRHVFNVQVDGEWSGSTIGGNGNSYMYIRDDADPTAPIIGLCTGQAVDGARYPLCLNFTGSLRKGVYAILIGHYDLGSNRDYTGDFSIKYIGAF